MQNKKKNTYNKNIYSNKTVKTIGIIDFIEEIDEMRACIEKSLKEKFVDVIVKSNHEFTENLRDIESTRKNIHREMAVFKEEITYLFAHVLLYINHTENLATNCKGLCFKEKRSLQDYYKYDSIGNGHIYEKI